VSNGNFFPPLGELNFKDFRRLPLSDAPRNRLGAIADAQLQYPNNNTKLLNLILANGHDPQRGLYLPLSDTPKLPNYFTRDIEGLPAAISPVDGWHLTHFLNPLTLPGEDRSRPSLRATNAGFLIVTHEFDCDSKAQFEETWDGHQMQGHSPISIKNYKNIEIIVAIASCLQAAALFTMIFCSTPAI